MKCWEQGDIDENVVLWPFLNLLDDKGCVDEEGAIFYEA